MKYRISELSIYVGDEWAMNVLENVEDKDAVYTKLLWLVETGDIKKHPHFKWLFDEDVTNYNIEVVASDKCRFVKETFEVTPGRTYGPPENCYPPETDCISEEELDGDECGLTESMEDLIVRLEYYDIDN
jgi:hypothetical protein